MSAARNRLARKRVTEDNPVFGAVGDWTQELGPSGAHQLDRYIGRRVGPSKRYIRRRKRRHVPVGSA